MSVNGPELFTALTAMNSSTKYELLSALPDSMPFDVAMLRTSWDDDVASLERGVDTRWIYPAKAARDPEILEYLTQIAARGAKVRVLASVPNRILISDRVRAVVPDTGEGPGPKALFITGRPLVRAIYTQFVEMWRASMPVGFSTGGLDVDLVRDTLSALQTGLTDEAAARQFGWSLRTYRRRIAAVLSLLGTTSRFEAGALARTQGWI
ncbi:MAG: hypothetical protein WKF57_05305 [Nakamurella sp.]